ncbi:YkgJ family cysteine cluster protein [bacterium]|nr:YkgJ family cysteine cluster protein [bacterium]
MDSSKVSIPPHIHQSIAQGLLYTHTRLNANQRKTLDAAAFLYALIEILEERGILTIEELDERKHVVAERLAEQLRREGLGTMLLDPETDKYSFEQSAEIDCAERLHLCKASCCRLSFALSKQDVREGIVHWALGRPYMIDQDEDGYCTHMNRNCLHCSIYEHRPVPCRGYDCRQDKRIWLDYEQKIPNPALAEDGWPTCLTAAVVEETP